jgi:putative ABC transport system permease protein
MGATRANIIALMVRQGMALAALGLAAGVLAAIAASQVLTTLLFGVSRLDPVTYITVIGLLAVISSVACAVPALRAAKVDPMVALRYE